MVGLYQRCLHHWSHSRPSLASVSHHQARSSSRARYHEFFCDSQWFNHRDIWTAVHCTAVNYILLHCTELHWIQFHWNTLKYISLHWTTFNVTTFYCTEIYLMSLQCTELHSITLQCTALVWSGLRAWLQLQGVGHWPRKLCVKGPISNRQISHPDKKHLYIFFPFCLFSFSSLFFLFVFLCRLSRHHSDHM